MKALMRVWSKAPLPIKLGFRAIRYWILRHIVGQETEVTLGARSFTVIHSNIDEYRSANQFVDFEPEFLEAFKSSAADSDVVYDIGGYIGMYSLAAVCCNKEVSVCCFEPQLANCQSISRNANANNYESIRVLHTALGDEEKQVALARTGQTGHVAALSEHGGNESASLTTLDLLVKREKLPPPDTIKIDVEGYEAHVLRGMQAILQLHRPTVLAEIHPKFMEKFGESSEGIDTFMERLGYKKFVLHEPSTVDCRSHSQSHVAFFPVERSSAMVEKLAKQNDLTKAGESACNAALVSVIMPTYKRPDLLPRAVQSVLTQTHRNLELIIVDDNSPDSTPDVVRSLMQEDDRIRYIRNEVNLDAPESRNVAIRNAKGEFIAFLDDDDEWMPQKLELQLKLINRYSVVGCLYNKNQRPSKMPHCDGEPPYEEKTIEGYHFNSTGFCPGSMLTRASYVREVGGFDSELPGPEGMDLYMQLVSRYGTAAYIKLPLHIYYTDEVHGKPRITTSKRLLGGALKEFEKNRHLRSPAAQRLRRCDIELMRSVLAERTIERVKYFLGSIRFVDPWKPITYSKIYMGRIFTRWPGIRQVVAVYRRVKYH